MDAIRPAGRNAPTRSSGRAARPGPGSAASASTRSRTSRCWKTSSSISDCAWGSSRSEIARATLEWCDRDLDAPPRTAAQLRGEHQPGGAGRPRRRRDRHPLRQGHRRPRRGGLVPRRVRRLRQGRPVRGAHRRAGGRASTPTRAAPAAQPVERAMTARLHYWYLTHPRLGPPGAAAGGAARAVDRRGVRRPAGQRVHQRDGAELDRAGRHLRRADRQLLPGHRRRCASRSPRPDRVWTGTRRAGCSGSLHALEAMAVNLAAANILTAEAGLFVGVVALALWLMKTHRQHLLADRHRRDRPRGRRRRHPGHHAAGPAGAGRPDRGVRRGRHRQARRGRPRLDDDPASR